MDENRTGENEGYRVFLSYRGRTKGADFCRELYRELTEDPLYKARYGEIYYSPKADDMNFITDMRRIMPTVKYFIMPLTSGYFNGFWDEASNAPSETSVTRLEILEAIRAKAVFIGIKFPGFDMKKHIELLCRLYGDDAESIYGTKLIDSADPQIFDRIKSILNISRSNVTRFADTIMSQTPNIRLMTKKKSEENSYDVGSLFDELYDVKSVTLLNLAATSFVAGAAIADVYNENGSLKQWFAWELTHGNISATVIILDPYSAAASDAEKCKMKPHGKVGGIDKIIIKNVNTLYGLMTKHGDIKLNVIFTQVALPYGVMMTEHHNRINDHMKVDLYAPYLHDDGFRPSFYMSKGDPETSALYTIFSDNVDSIAAHGFRFDGHPDISWLKNDRTPIIHRARLTPDLLPHTRDAFEACIDAKVPIEVDLLRLSSGDVIVGRGDFDVSPYLCGRQKLSQCSLGDIDEINRKLGRKTVLGLGEFFELIAGRIPVLFEIKTERIPEGERDGYVTKIVSMLQNYSKKYSYLFAAEYGTYGHPFAVHSADINAVKLVKELDALIPCGIISSEFDFAEDDSLRAMHKRDALLGICGRTFPDFLSYDLRCIGNGIARDVVEKCGIPLFGWTVRSEADRRAARNCRCDNIITEPEDSFF